MSDIKGNNKSNPGTPQTAAAGEQLPTKPIIIVKLIRENHEAELTLQRTGSNTANPLLEDLQAALAEKGITTGIKEDLLKELVYEPVYNRPLVAAVGKKPSVGANGELRYNIRTEYNLRPLIKEDGTADYKDLGFTNNVLKGQTLVDIIPPQAGEDGIDILGKILPGILGKEARSPQGAGTEISEDGAHLIASVSGNAIVKNGVVSIQEVLKIKGNVDNSTGDIHFVGDIQISGDVVSGFNVTSEANIAVKGTVEGARLEAKGDIIISEGVNGMNRGVLKAGGSIKCRFLQNCFITAGGNVFSDTIMYCTMECDGDVELAGKRGALIGGNSSITGKLITKTIGADSHPATQINMVSTGLAKKKEQEEMQRQIDAIDAEINKLVQLLNRFESLQKQNRLNEDHVKTIMTVKSNYVALSGQRRDLMANLENVRREQLELSAQSNYIECKDRIHTGVRIAFGPLIYNVQESFVHSRLSLVNGEILISTI